MISDIFILKSLEGVVQRLEISLQKFSLTPDSFNQHDLSDDTLQILEVELSKMKNISDSLIRDIKKRTLKTIDIDFVAVEKILNTLSSLSKSSNNLQELVTNVILEYTALFCYYSITNNCVNHLLNSSEVRSYYKLTADSKIFSMLYALQISPSKIWDFSTSIVHNINNKISGLGKNEVLSVEKVKSIVIDIFEEVRTRMNSIIMVQSFKFVGLPNKPTEEVSLLLGLPKSLLRSELTKKVENIDTINRDFTIKLGKIIQEFQRNKSDSSLDRQSESLRFFLDLPDDSNMIDIIYCTDKYCRDNSLIKIQKPNLITRYWPISLLTIFYGPSFFFIMWNSRFKALEFLKENIVDFVSGLAYNWIWKPLKQVWATVRHDDNSSIAMISQYTLDSELNSLTRMVVDLVTENALSDIDVTELTTQIEHGDLTQFMEIYENQLENPVKNIISGKLIRSLLVQVQKTKVDGSLALNGIDKMLKSQQLVFGVLAMSPALLIVYTLFSSAYRLIKLGSVWTNIENMKLKLNQSMTNIERILNYSNLEYNQEESYFHQGQLTIEISNISRLGAPLLPSARRYEWLRDVEELIDSNMGFKFRSNIIDRIYHSYGKYF